MSYSPDYIRQWFEAIRDETRIHANTHTRIGQAFLMLLNYILDSESPFIRKDQADSTNYLLSLLAGAVIGEAGNIRLNPDGSISCGKLTVEGSAIFNEIVFNHQNILEGDTYFTDHSIIEAVSYNGNGQYTLTMRKLYDNDVITFHAYDVLLCSMNNLDTARTYKNSWMRVDSVDTDTNSMVVTLYDGEDVPGGINCAPEASAKVIRWGNQLDEDRQQTWFVSSKDGRFLFLQGVTQPILSDNNYSAFFGVPPSLDIFDNLPINARQPYVFARGLIVQDIIKLDYQGNPQYTARDKGAWDSKTQYIRGYDETEKGYYVDRVWHGGCLWQAAVSLPTVGKEPRFNNADWVCLLGGDNMSLDIISSAGDGFPAGGVWNTTLKAYLYNAEMLIGDDEIGYLNILWERISEDTSGDTAWNLRHPAGSVGFELPISSEEDFPGNVTGGSIVGFRCTVSISGRQQVSNDYSIIM